MPRILICGDSYCVTDPDYPGLHWSEKILASSHDYELCNLAYGGCSNALIALQLLQGLQLKPDFVILSFTNEGRYEVDKDTTTIPLDLTSNGLSAYIKQRYTTNNYSIDADQLKIINQYKTLASSETFEKIKNYFYIGFCLQTLYVQNINFCYSLGGFEYQQDYISLLRSNYLRNICNDYTDRQLATNLWYYGREPRPYFHVTDDRVQTLFANECMSRI